jgi:plastocyanin
MKKISQLLICSLISFNAMYANVVITVGPGINNFSPSSVNITLGEKITFNISGNHSVISATLPASVSSFSSGGGGAVSSWDYTPTVVGTYGVECGVHGSSMSGSFTVNTSSPTITTGTISPLTFCGGNDITVPYTTTGSVSGFSVQLSNATGSFTNPTALITTGSTSTDITANISVTTPGTGYRVRVVSNAQTITGTANSQNISINVAITPTASFNWNPIGAICTSDAVTFTGVTSNLSGASINWYFNTTLAGAAINTYVRNTMGNGDVGFAVITGTTVGCNPTPYSTTVPGYVATVSGVVTPTLSISSLPAHICFGDTISISGSPNGGGSTPIFSLFVDNTSTAGGNTASTKIKGMSVGTHSIYAIMKGSLSCATVQSVTSNVLTVTVNALPAVPTISKEIIVCITTPCESNPNTIISSAISGNQWLNTATGIITTATAQSFSTTLSGTYKVVATLNGCSVTSSGFNLSVTSSNTTTTGTTTGVSEEIAKAKISIYPNPVTTKLMVATEQEVKKSELQIKIYDLNQKLVLSQTFTEGICKGGKGKECLCPGLSEIDVTSLSEGLYIVQIIDGNTILLSNKLVKQ